jgi:hypothetical protein
MTVFILFKNNGSSEEKNLGEGSESSINGVKTHK